MASPSSSVCRTPQRVSSSCKWTGSNRIEGKCPDAIDNTVLLPLPDQLATEFRDWTRHTDDIVKALLRGAEA
jgi:hypothetical protein